MSERGGNVNLRGGFTLLHLYSCDVVTTVIVEHEKLRPNDEARLRSEFIRATNCKGNPLHSRGLVSDLI